MALSTTTAVRAAVLAGAGPAVLSELAVADDVAGQRLHHVPLTGLDLHRELRAIWAGPSRLPAGAVRDLITHIVTGPPAKRRLPGPPGPTRDGRADR